MTLNELKRGCEMEASIVKVTVKDKDGNTLIKGYNELTDKERKDNIRFIKRDITNKYCDYDELSYFSKDPVQKENAENWKSAYWAATLLAYWGKIYDWKASSSSLGLPDSDYFDWLNDSVHDAFYYRSWRKKRRVKPNDPNSEWMDNPQYVDDENAADKSINFFCGARRGKEYQAANKDKRRANYQSLSIDQTFDEDGYSILDRKGLSVSGQDGMGLKGLVNLLLTQDKVLEAVIIDSIANGDSFKESKTKVTNKTVSEVTGEEEEESYYKYSYDFNPRKLVKFLNSIDEKYFTEYFNREYHLSDCHKVLDQLHKLPNAKLYKEVEKTILVIKNNPELLSFVL